MKLTHVQTRIVRLPADEPLAGGPSLAGATRDFVALRLGTDAGIEGIGLTGFGGALTGELRSAVDALATLALGEDPLRIESVIARLGAAAAPSGPGGLLTLALAAIDIALWDIKGKACGMALARLLVEEVPLPLDGHLTVPAKPGLGLAFDEAVLKRYGA